MLIYFVLLMIAIVLLSFWRIFLQKTKNRKFARRAKSDIPAPVASNAPKPDWVKWEVLALHEQFDLSHRKLAALFNQLHLAKTGQSVGRTYVRQLLIKEEHRRLHLQKELKHAIPAPMEKNAMWAIDTTYIVDQTSGKPQIVLGIIDCGTRMNLALRYVKRFNAWTFLTHLFLTIIKFGKPVAIKTDNCAVFHSKMVRLALKTCGIIQRFSRPGRPWENGYIERLFGSLKAMLKGYAIRDTQHLALTMAQFQFWYNNCRPHQHLMGQTPAQKWHGVNPFKRIPQKQMLFDFWEGKLKGLVLCY